MYKLEIFTRVHSPYIWRTCKRANAPDIVNRQLSAASERALASIVASTQSSDILIFTSNALKTWALHVNTFYSWILLYISPVTAVNIYLFFPYCISLIYFSFTKIRMFLYAQIYWLAEFGDVSCVQFNYLRVETPLSLSLRPGRILSDNFKSNTLFKSDETLCPT